MNGARVLSTRLNTRTQYSVLGTQYSVLSTRYSVLSTRYSVLGTRYSVLGTRYSVLGTHDSPSLVTAPAGLLLYAGPTPDRRRSLQTSRPLHPARPPQCGPGDPPAPGRSGRADHCCTG